MRIVISLGGSALLTRGERPDAWAQRRHVGAAARALAPLAVEHEIVVCHANGPQISTLALESENDDTLTRPYPLDVLGAQTQGMIGYWIVQELRRAGVTRPLVAMVTQTVVDMTDPGFARPTAFVGPAYTRDQVQLWAGELGWQMALDGTAWRRVVPTVLPTAVVELPTIAALLAQDTVVVCGGGGGVPVCAEGESAHPHCTYGGVDAVVDADRTAALIATELDADLLVLLTDVTDVRLGYGTFAETAVRHASVVDVVGWDLEANTMGAKVEAARQFVLATGRHASIGLLRDAAAVVAGKCGTILTPA